MAGGWLWFHPANLPLVNFPRIKGQTESWQELFPYEENWRAKVKGSGMSRGGLLCGGTQICPSLPRHPFLQWPGVSADSPPSHLSLGMILGLSLANLVMDTMTVFLKGLHEDSRLKFTQGCFQMYWTRASKAGVRIAILTSNFYDKLVMQ